MRAIDVRHLGRERVICCWQVGDAIVDPGPESCSATLLEELEDRPPPAILLTHIHLDHAGATGALVRQWPEIQVHVHEAGAPHLVDPSRLLASARRLYGDDMDRLWGEVLPVPEANVHALAGGESVQGFRVAYTPGHASHHVCYLHEESGWAFVGDVAGVKIAGSDHVMAPTPPPDIDVEAWESSLRTVAAWHPTALGLTHFGAVEEVDGHLGRVGEALRRSADVARERDEVAFVAWVDEELAASAGADAPTYRQAAPPEQLWAGLRRYWDKRLAA